MEYCDERLFEGVKVEPTRFGETNQGRVCHGPYLPLNAPQHVRKDGAGQER